MSGRSGRRMEHGVLSNKMNSPADSPLLHYSITPALLVLGAEEFHDIAPPVDYSLIPPWLIFLGVFVSLTDIGLLVWFVASALRRPAAIQSPGDRALAELEPRRAAIATL